MLLLTTEQFRRALGWMALLHIIIIAASNYLVQFPFTFFGLHSTWGALSFPFIFLATDLTVRIFGKPLARRIVFAVMLPALLVSYLVSVLFSEGHYTRVAALLTFNIFVARIAIASFTAYTIGQLMDIAIFDRLRRHRRWWVAPAASTLVGNLVDTVIFFSIAFHASSDAFMAAHWPEIAALDYAFKLAVSMLFFLPAYGVLLGVLQRHLLRVQGAGGREQALG